MFNNTRLLDKVAYGSAFGQEFKTTIKTLNNGSERRNADWSMPLGRYSIVYDALAPEDHWRVRDAFMASMGSAIAFRFKDWTDYIAKDEFIVNTTEVGVQTFQLVKNYKFGGNTLQRFITKPIVNTVQLMVDGVVQNTISVDDMTGIVAVNIQKVGRLTWNGEFDVPVRFESDVIELDPITTKGKDFYLSTDVDLVEVRE